MKKNITAGDRELNKKQKSGKLSKKSEIKSIISGLKTASELGFTLVVPLVGGAFLGSYLDRRLNSSPKITLSLIFLGLFLGLYSMYRTVKELIKE